MQCRLEDNPAIPSDIRGVVEFLELVLDNVYSGIIVCDTDCRIVFMNKVYGELLNADRHQAVGRPIEEYFPSSRLSQVLSSGRPELGQRCSLRTQTPLLVNRIPLNYKGRTIGVILHTIFKDYQAFADLAGRMKLLETEINYYKKGLRGVLSARYTFESIIGHSEVISELKDMGRKYAQTDSPVLITGATGTGKELFAHAVHNASPRREGPFVCVNCAAIPRELLESEMFGYESGAFTGAAKGGKPGQIELAHGGTLYLDEIGDLPLNAQAKLLRVLETKMLDKLGCVKSTQVDFRLVAATNKDLKEMITRRLFREDLFYRLNTMTISLPSLAERREDIPALVSKLLSDMGRSDVALSDEAMAACQGYSWPGNIRELKNAMERALSLTEDQKIQEEQLPLEVIKNIDKNNNMSDNPNSPLADELARCEREVLKRTMASTQGNMSKAAKILGISRSTLYQKCHRYQLV